MQLFIEQNVNLDVETNKNLRPIHFASSKMNNFISDNQLKAVIMLINQKVDMNAMSNDGMRPFHHFCSGITNMDTENLQKVIELFVENSQLICMQ